MLLGSDHANEIIFLGPSRSREEPSCSYVVKNGNTDHVLSMASNLSRITKADSNAVPLDPECLIVYHTYLLLIALYSQSLNNSSKFMASILDQ